MVPDTFLSAHFPRTSVARISRGFLPQCSISFQCVFQMDAFLYELKLSLALFRRTITYLFCKLCHIPVALVILFQRLRHSSGLLLNNGIVLIWQKTIQ
jgi:hypothetical protein